MLLHEGDNVAARLTTETVEDLLLDRDGEGGRFFIVKRTEPLVIPASRAQRDAALGDDFDNIAPAPNFINRFAGNLGSCTRLVHGEFAPLLGLLL